MKNNLVMYPAVFHKNEDEESYYTVVFPDLKNVFTDGKTIEEAINKAEEVLGLSLFDQKELPESSSIESLKKKYSDDYIAFVVSDLSKAAKEVHRPYVRKNTRIPADIAEEAEKRGINFSATLTRALEQELEK